MNHQTKENVLFISSMDASVGKTVTTGMIAEALAEAGEKVTTQKTIQTGCGHVLEGIEVYRQIQGLPFTDEDTRGLTRPYIFTYPCSPHMAAAEDEGRVDLDTITQVTRRSRETYEYILLEGAGGLMIPNDMEPLTIDYVKEQAYPLILVTSGKLGSINHTLLNLYACERYGIEIKAIIYNQYSSIDPLIETSTLGYLKAKLPEISSALLPGIKKESGEPLDTRPLLQRLIKPDQETDLIFSDPFLSGSPV